MWEDEDGLLPDQRIQTVLEQHTVHLGDDTVRSQVKGIIYVTSQRSAKLMMTRLMSELPDHNSTESLACIEAWNNGIGVGPKIRRQGNINRGVHQYLHRGHSQIFFEGKWLYNSTARSRGQEKYRFDPISNMEILNPHERVATRDNCRPLRLIQCHLFPIHQKKPGDNHILAISTGPHTRHSTLFQEGGIGHPPPLPEAEDVMLAVHGPTCAVKSIEFCVVMGVHDAPVEGGGGGGRQTRPRTTE
ncbi:hypothetical protein R1sor_026669 [Riccia sorocarpa]|uniref:Uncharacterized protein n=1 Tax=Riccia sorocarpa TaxID=122646 RepID=A0ABD3GFQ5_9MARC